MIQSITYSEAIRLRKSNETQTGYLSRLKHLKDECMKSGFNKGMVISIISTAQTWIARFQPPKLKKMAHRQKKKTI